MRDYRTETRKYKTGCGELRVRIAFKGDESFHFLLASLDKQDNECGACWLEVSANLLTALLRRIKPNEIPALIKNLKNQRCKYGIQNCPTAIAKAIEEVFKDRKDA
jgi:hypothetical protein